jgi:cyanophycin synthetase
VEITILDIRVYKGRNVYSHRKVVRAIVDIGKLYDTPTKDIDGFNEKILECFPGLGKHYCSLGYEGGFRERLEEGTYLAHLIEHLTLELQSIAGSEVRYGRTRLFEENQIYEVVFEYELEQLAIECIVVAVESINALIAGEVPDVEEINKNLSNIAAKAAIGPSSRAICEAAAKRNIAVRKIGNDSVFQLGLGKHLRIIQASLTDRPSCLDVDIACNKHMAKLALARAGIPIPYGEVAYTHAAALLHAQQIGYPVVVKPADANQGKGVSIDLNTDAEVITAFKEASKYSRAVIIEKYITGKDYRVLVVGGKVSAVAERRPPSVTGDGIHTIKELVEIENENPLRGIGHEKPLTKLSIDNTTRQLMEKKGISENYLLPFGKTFALRQNGNISTGGTARDCTDEIHPHNIKLAIAAAEVFNLDIAGVDITAEDISLPIDEGNGAVIEVNAAPGLRMHLFPSSGSPRNVGDDIVDMLFPDGSTGCIPVVSVTGTNGKTTTSRLIAHTLGLTGKIVGLTCTNGIYIGTECIMKGDCTGAISAETVLSNKQVEAAVLETARGGIIRRGLGYDKADVGVIVNISEDHLGSDGIETKEDIAHVKSLVAEAVKEDGYAVLNADDSMTSDILKRIKHNAILFSSNYQNDLIKMHLRKGGKCVIAKEGTIFACSGRKKTPIAEINNIPITFCGKAICNIENSLAAVSALVALEVKNEIIREGLYSFKPDIKSNPGRFNIFDMGDFKIMLDYGHNPAGYAAVLDFIKGLGAGRYIGIIGVPGDRCEKSIREVGALCGEMFSKIYIKEDKDPRRRKKGEVSSLLLEGVLASGFDKRSIDIILDEKEALMKAISEAQTGDLIVMFYEEFEPLLKVIEEYDFHRDNDAHIQDVIA